jgi:hypothetical protein
MNENEIGLGRLFVQEAVKAGTWGIVFLIIMGMFIFSIKQDIKEGIAYGIDRAYTRAVMIGTDPYLIGKVRQLIKEGAEPSSIKTEEDIGAIPDEDYKK